jgi:predicted nucleic acid-binding protein
VPATERAFTEIPPAHLYLDTNILLDHLTPNRPHHGRAVALLLHLAEHDLTTLYLSVIAWTELAHTVTRRDFRDALPQNWQQHYALSQWDQQPIRAAYLAAWLALVDQMLAPFAWEEISVTPDVRVRALQHMMAFNLQATDAVHLACAEAVGVMDFASFDRGFRRIDGLYLWNDYIHGH